MTSRFYSIIYNQLAWLETGQSEVPCESGNNSSYLSPAYLTSGDPLPQKCSPLRFILYRLSDWWCYVVREEWTSVILAYLASLASFNKRNHDFSFRDPRFPRPDQWGPKRVSERASLRIKSKPSPDNIVEPWIKPGLKPSSFHDQFHEPTISLFA